MSIISDFFEKLMGSDEEKKTFDRPCSNCPADCALAGEACDVCEPYKKKLIDTVYHVDHLEDYYDRYEIVPDAQSNVSGTVHCPFCGANSADVHICEYCGSRLSEGPVSSGKIRVASASEIPNPIMEAQDIIWDRYDAVVNKYSRQERSSSGGFLSDLVSQLIGTEGEKTAESALGAQMSESEVKEAAALYGVGVGDYLTGLDNGKYLTLSGKKAADEQSKSSSYTPASFGIPGMAGIGMFADALFNERYHRDPFRTPQPVRRPSSDRPARPNESMDGRRPVRPEQRPQTSQPQVSRRRPAEQTSPVPDRVERRRPQSSDVNSFPERESERKRSGNRRDNMISRTTGELKSPRRSDDDSRRERRERDKKRI